jgi:PGF-CTERM protein
MKLIKMSEKKYNPSMVGIVVCSLFPERSFDLHGLIKMQKQFCLEKNMGRKPYKLTIVILKSQKTLEQ